DKLVTGVQTCALPIWPQVWEWRPDLAGAEGAVKDLEGGHELMGRKIAAAHGLPADGRDVSRPPSGVVRLPSGVHAVGAGHVERRSEERRGGRRGWSLS